MGYQRPEKKLRVCESERDAMASETIGETLSLQYSVMWSTGGGAASARRAVRV